MKRDRKSVHATTIAHTPASLRAMEVLRRERGFWNADEKLVREALVIAAGHLIYQRLNKEWQCQDHESGTKSRRKNRSGAGLKKAARSGSTR